MQPSDIDLQKFVLFENKCTLYKLPNAFKNTPRHDIDGDRNPELD
jgi:hypothetical protein